MNSKCEIVANCLASKDYEGYRQHLHIFCHDCLRGKMSTRHAVEIFPTGPPWLNEGKEVEEQEEEEVPKSRFPKKITTKTDANKIIITADKVDEYLVECVINGMSDSLLSYEIQKRKGLTKSAARVLAVELLSKHSEERLKNSLSKKGVTSAEPLAKRPKVVNEKQFLPWSPFPRQDFDEEISSFPSEVHKRYIAIISNLMQTGGYRFESNKIDLKNFQDQSKEERINFVEAALNNFKNVYEIAENDLNPITRLTRHHAMMIRNRMINRWEKSIGSFSLTPLSVIELNDESNFHVDGVPLTPVCKSILISGRPEKLEIPNMQVRCSVEVDLDSYPPKCSNMFPIKDDESVFTLCHENSVRYAMDATTACHLMSESFNGQDYEYAIPVDVVQELFQGGMVTVVCLGKPRVIGTVRNSCITRKLIKLTAKSNFVKHNRIERYEAQKKKNGDSEKDECSTLSSSNDGNANDPLDNIMSAIISKSSSSKEKEKFSGTGKRYSIFSAGSHQLLIRSTPPYQTSGHASKVLTQQSVTFQPFQELLPNFSAMELSPEEHLWNDLKMIFKQADMSVLMRSMKWAKNKNDLVEVLQIQPRMPYLRNDHDELQKKLTELLGQRTKRLENILSNLEGLIPGRYMLVNNRRNKLEILQETDENSKDTFPKSKEYSTGGEPKYIEDIFHGFENRVPLQWQIVANNAPGCYLPDGKLMAGILNTARGKKRDFSQNEKRNRKKGGVAATRGGRGGGRGARGAGAGGTGAGGARGGGARGGKGGRRERRNRNSGDTSTTSELNDGNAPT